MAVPTVTSVSPASGLTGGSYVVEVRGTGFQLPPDPPATGKTTAPNPSVEVLFGAAKGRDVAVVSPTRLFVVAPIHDPGAVGLTVRNVDQAGAVVPGETVTVANAFTFSRPDLTAPSDLQRLVRTLLSELARQVLAEVNMLVHTDYDESPGDGLDVTQIAKLPALVVTGPETRENRFFSLNQAREVPTGTPGEFFKLGVPYTVDLTFGIVGATGGDGATQMLLNLMAATARFFARNDYLRMVRDPAGDPDDLVEYEMDVTPDGDLKAKSAPNNSNLRWFQGEFVVRGFDLDDPRAAVAVGRETEDQPAPGGVNEPSAVELDGDEFEQIGGP